MAELHGVETLATSTDNRGRRGRRSLRRRILTTVGIVVGVLILLVAGLAVYLAVQQRRSPSGTVFIQTAKGKVQLQVPQVVVPPPTPTSANLGAAVPSPPTDLSIPEIGLHAQIYMMAQAPPKAAVVGWMYGSAMPGTAGNVVLYGARGGPYAVFQKLNTLASGDEVTVAAGTVAYVYRIRSIQEVPADQTNLLLPSSTPTLTLITDAGSWDASAGHYTRRLVAQGTYVAREPWSGK